MAGVSAVRDGWDGCGAPRGAARGGRRARASRRPPSRRMRRCCGGEPGVSAPRRDPRASAPRRARAAPAARKRAHGALGTPGSSRRRRPYRAPGRRAARRGGAAPRHPGAASLGAGARGRAGAGLTPYHAIRRALTAAGTSAVVIGVGGLGHVAVQLLEALSPRAGRRRRPSRRGARAGARSGRRRRASAGCDARRVRRRRRRRRRRGPRLRRQRRDARARRRRGRARRPRVDARAGRRDVPDALRGACRSETTVIFSNWGTRAELAEVVALARDGVIGLEVERVALDGCPGRLRAPGAGDGARPPGGRPTEGGMRPRRTGSPWSPGGGSGIGEAICTASPPRARASRHSTSARAAPRRPSRRSAAGWRCTPTSPTAPRSTRALAQVERDLGPIDILVNNAGAVGAAHLERVMPLLEIQRAEALRAA